MGWDKSRRSGECEGEWATALVVVVAGTAGSSVSCGVVVVVGWAMAVMLYMTCHYGQHKRKVTAGIWPEEWRQRLPGGVLA